MDLELNDVAARTGIRFFSEQHCYLDLNIIQAPAAGVDDPASNTRR